MLARLPAILCLVTGCFSKAIKECQNVDSKNIQRMRWFGVDAGLSFGGIQTGNDGIEIKNRGFED